MHAHPYLPLLLVLAACTPKPSVTEFDIAFRTNAVVPHTKGAQADIRPWYDAVDPGTDHAQSAVQSNACGIVELQSRAESLSQFLSERTRVPDSTKSYQGVIGEFCTTAEFNVGAPTLLMVRVSKGVRYLRAKATVHFDPEGSPYISDSNEENRELITDLIDAAQGRWCSGDMGCRAHTIYLSSLSTSSNKEWSRP
jgi:hypothetical protein